jgi:capsular polysaccharide biosynthesis protein
MPPVVGPLPAVLAHPFLTAIPIVLLMITTVGLALVRTPVYTAESELVVGRVDSSAAAIPGYVSATQQLASDYSRLIHARQITDSLTTSLHIPASQVNLSATPIPNSAIIRVDATGTDLRRAVQLADSGTTALISYVTGTVAGTSQAQSLLDQLHQAQVNLSNANQAQADAQARINQYQGSAANADKLALARQDLANAQGNIQTFTVQVNAFTQAYTARVQELNGAPLQVIIPAYSQGTDRKKKLEDAVAFALVVGGALGLGWSRFVTNGRLVRFLATKARPRNALNSASAG